ncbi:MAG: BrnT family toxin [Candidatus Rokuibacteriota bacterium]
MEFEWDPRKAVANVRKHGVDFADAGTALHDERAITITDGGSDDEERFVTLGMDALGRVLVVVYTWHEDHPRLISARKATPRERRQYEGAR